LQAATREIADGYVYLEIGSYLGGSIQPHLLDEKCALIYSIDKRPASQPDARGLDYHYQNNSTNRMLEKLREVAPDNLTKIVCFDGDASEIDSTEIEKRKPQICFIDGEHTDVAAWNDFQFCLKVLDQNGAILFHDAAVIYNGLEKIINYLKEKGTKFRAYHLPDVMFVIEFGDFPLYKNAKINEFLVNNYSGYLFSLQFNDHYRNFTNKSIFRWYRGFRVWLNRGNVSE
jgi:Methyltransferase domain